jgi:hypothetical protein
MTLSPYSPSPPSPRPSWRGHVPKRSLRKAQHDEIVGFLVLFIGVALFVGPFVVGQPDAARDAHVNESVVGVFLVFTACRRLYAGGGLLSDVLILVAGGWLAASPFLLDLLGDTVVDEARVLDVSLGSVLVALAVISLALLRAARRTPPGEEV